MSQSIYETVTSEIVKALEAGVVPWRKPWCESAVPENAVSKHPYRGVNHLLLGISRFGDHRWLTLRQAGELGGSVRRGEKSSMVVFWKRWVPDVQKETLESKPRFIPLLRYYRVFNAEQCNGLRLPALSELQARPQHDRIDRAEALVRDMPNPPLMGSRGDSAFYSPMIDAVHVPDLSRFVSPDSYYATLFHELGHATGHESRLARKGVRSQVRFGSEDYSHEELVAELTSAFCCAYLGLDNTMLENAASYIAGWLKVLKGDPKAVVVASAQAQRAADYIRGIKYDRSEASCEL